MLHEISVHRGDLEIALGRSPEYDPALAVDGVDEFLTVLPFAASFEPRIRALTGDGETLHLHATDGDTVSRPAEWLITLEPIGFRWSHTHAKGAAAVRGPVSELYLFAWGRRPPRAMEIEGLGAPTLPDHWGRNSPF